MTPESQHQLRQIPESRDWIKVSGLRPRDAKARLVSRANRRHDRHNGIPNSHRHKNQIKLPVTK